MPAKTLGVLCALVLLNSSSVALAQTPPADRTGDPGKPAKGRVYYVRQTVGDDSNDGLSPGTAWQHVSRLAALRAGDTAYVGPGLYREQVTVVHSGTAESPIRLIADPTGRHTGDPPGAVMLSGAEPMDESIFTRHSEGVYKASIARGVGGVTEMGGRQRRYWKVKDAPEFQSDTYSPLEIVKNRASSFFYDAGSRTLYIHTSDGLPPQDHEIELLFLPTGIAVTGSQYVTVAGFTFRHFADAGIGFFDSSNCVAIQNTAYGSRQGIRVMEANQILIAGNTFFRNENSGVYFLRQSTDGMAIGNIAYENLKGLRWSSGSGNGLASGNTVFENDEAGISIEEVDHMRLLGNRLIDNGETQLLVYKSQYHSEGNCFHNNSPQQSIASFLVGPRFLGLAEYQEAIHEDRSSREGGCDSLLHKIDVHELHDATTGYTGRRRQLPVEPHRAPN